MAEPATPAPNELALLVGDYYAAHDKCLYRVGRRGGQLQLSRCCWCGPEPAADAFSDPYPTTPAQVRYLLAFGSLIPAI